MLSRISRRTVSIIQSNKNSNGFVELFSVRNNKYHVNSIEFWTETKKHTEPNNKTIEINKEKSTPINTTTPTNTTPISKKDELNEFKASIIESVRDSLKLSLSESLGENIKKGIAESIKGGHYELLAKEQLEKTNIINELTKHKAESKIKMISELKKDLEILKLIRAHIESKENKRIQDTKQKEETLKMDKKISYLFLASMTLISNGWFIYKFSGGNSDLEWEDYLTPIICGLIPFKPFQIFGIFVVWVNELMSMM